MKEAKMKTISINLMLLILTCISCKKEKNSSITEIIGKTVELENNKPIANIQVILASMPKDQAFKFGVAYSVETIFSSNDKGDFFYKWNADENKIYAVLCKGQNPYFDTQYYDVTISRKNQIAIQLIPPAYVKFHIKNVNNSDVIGIGGITNLLFYGNNVDVDTLISTTGNKNITINWSVAKGSTQLHQDTSIYISGFDTIPFEIRY